MKNNFSDLTFTEKRFNNDDKFSVTQIDYENGTFSSYSLISQNDSSIQENLDEIEKVEGKELEINWKKI